MDSRHSQLEDALRGLDATDIPLVSLNSSTYAPSGYTDDLGIYYFIPQLAKIFDISIDQAIDIFFTSLLWIGMSFSLFFFFSIFKHWGSRLTTTIGLLLLTYAAYRYAEVHIAAFFSVASLVPMWIHWHQTSGKLNWKFFLGIALSGLVIGYCNIIRSHAGTGTFLFISALFLLNLANKHKFIAISALIIFSAIPYLHFKVLETNRDQYLMKIHPDYHPLSILHPRWHSIYIGFGYLENKYGITYDDTISDLKARTVNPKVVYCSNEYERILRDQCFLLLKNDPLFVFKTVFFKILKLFFTCLKFSNLGLLLAFLYIKPSLRYTTPFLIAAMFYSVSGILVIPLNAYVMGMVSTATLFGITMIGLSIEKYVSSMRRAENLI